MYRLLLVFYLILLSSICGSSLAGAVGADNTRIYKILRAAEWAEFSNNCHYRGTTTDRTDGFIHFAGSDQVNSVIATYFKGAGLVYILEYKASSFGASLRWEVAPSGELYPHVYGRSLGFSGMTAMSTKQLDR